MWDFFFEGFQKELQHCIVTYSQELNIMQTQSILWEQFQTTSTNFEDKMYKKNRTSWQWYMKYVYLIK